VGLHQEVDRCASWGYSPEQLPDAVEQMCSDVLPQYGMVVSDDDSAPVNPQGENPIASESAVVELQSAATPSVDSNDPELWTLQAHVDAADFAGLVAGVSRDSEVWAQGGRGRLAARSVRVRRPAHPRQLGGQV
jgi:hypothetical protein